MTSLLTEGLVRLGHDVTLFATGDSTTRARLHALFPHGYWHDQHMWPWELYEMLNLAAAVERAAAFDIIHYEAAYYPMSLAFSRLSPTPVVQTLHHSPSESEMALWSPVSGGAASSPSPTSRRACSRASTSPARSCTGSTPTASRSATTPDDYLLFLGRFTPGKGVLQAIEVARHARA